MQKIHKIIIMVLFGLGVLIAFTNCSVKSDPNRNQAIMVSQVFSDDIQQFVVKVYYEPSAVPYTGVLNITQDTWDITKQSYQALFQNHTGRTVQTPVSTSDMTLLPAQGVTNWSSQQLLDLGRSSAAALMPNSTTINISVLFVNGKFNGSNSILGVHFTGYPFVFVFKDVVTSVGGTANEQKYVEQAVVVHEIGHAVGLVNNGLPMFANHEDSSHAKHSSNSQCVMYWQVESASTILSALTNFILSGDLNLFSTDSLNDGREYHP